MDGDRDEEPSPGLLDFTKRIRAVDALCDDLQAGTGTMSTLKSFKSILSSVKWRVNISCMLTRPQVIIVWHISAHNMSVAQ